MLKTGMCAVRDNDYIHPHRLVSTLLDAKTMPCHSLVVVVGKLPPLGWRAAG